MYEKEIKESLRNTYHSKMGLNDSSYEKVANILGASVEKEDQIENAVKGAEGWLKVVQGEADIVRKSQNPPKDPPKPTNPPKPNDPPQDDISTIVRNAIAEAVKPLNDEIAGLKKEKLQISGKEKILSIFKEKGIDPNYYEPVIEGRSLETEDEINALVTSVTNGFSKFKQTLNDQSLGGIPKPILGDPNKEGVSSNVQAYIERKAQDKKENSLGGKAL